MPTSKHNDVGDENDEPNKGADADDKGDNNNDDDSQGRKSQ